MKAPEKIYLQQNTTTDCYEEWWPEWFEARAKDTDIEYTRTNAMLDKVYDFIIANVYKYGKVKFVDNRATFDFRMNTFLNDLKQAMEE